MKILHLADLHIGKSLGRISLLPDQEYILKQILEMVQNHAPSAVVISGDVYDKAVPGTEAVRVFDDFLTALSDGGVSVLMVSGNHDSPERLGFGGRIMAEQAIYIQSAFAPGCPPVVLEDEYGPVNFYLLPFLKPALLRYHLPDSRIETYQDAVETAISKLKVDLNVRNVLVTHQFFVSSTGEVIRSDSEIEPVGGLSSVNAGIAADFDYVAMGHLHRPQRAGAEGMRYAGSPLKYSFSETNHKKSACLVTLCEKGRVQVDLLPLTPLRELRQIRGPIEELTGEMVASEGNREDFLQVTLTDEGETPDALARLRRVYPNVVELRFDNSRTRAETALSEEAFSEGQAPEELFASFFSLQNGIDMSEVQAAIAAEFLEKAGDMR